jgi:hypothetical protein
MNDCDYKDFRKMFMDVSDENMYRMISNYSRSDVEKRRKLQSNIVRYEKQYGNPIGILRDHQEDMAIYIPLISSENWYGR